ncbi:hypothetical protein [Methanoplanus limicola]|uniref:Uncharacterized protein n=1 Tax=Methanoplanus limicola DSM 2279 TaxID=937775 RepID=H1Z0B5_9EURY|nr:hypothetical protein [Methanoplanus limicola]EHQ34382.1 hypothetical protein Metlim_0235 [Methanoplanus limicola DSM 2279]
MPIFNGIYCLRKFITFAVSVILILTLASFLATLAMGIIAGIGVIGIGIVLLLYVLDQYGNYLLMDPAYYMNREDMEKFGKIKLNKSLRTNKEH